LKPDERFNALPFCRDFGGCDIVIGGDTLAVLVLSKTIFAWLRDVAGLLASLGPNGKMDRSCRGARCVDSLPPQSF
jgi:hypothetical protein